MVTPAGMSLACKSTQKGAPGDCCGGDDAGRRGRRAACTCARTRLIIGLLHAVGWALRRPRARLRCAVLCSRSCMRRIVRPVHAEGATRRRGCVCSRRVQRNQLQRSAVRQGCVLWRHVTRLRGLLSALRRLHGAGCSGLAAGKACAALPCTSLRACIPCTAQVIPSDPCHSCTLPDLHGRGAPAVGSSPGSRQKLVAAPAQRLAAAGAVRGRWAGVPGVTRRGACCMACCCSGSITPHDVLSRAERARCSRARSPSCVRSALGVRSWFFSTF